MENIFGLEPDMYRILGNALEHYVKSGAYPPEDEKLLLLITEILIQNEEKLSELYKKITLGSNNDLLDYVKDNL